MYVEIKNINKQYGEQQVLDKVSLAIEKGEFVTLLGPSGCGKSTLLRSIAGLEEINGGALYIDGSNVTTLPSKDRNVGMVFQSYALFPNMTVYDNVAFGLKMAGVSKEAVKTRVEEMIELVDLKGREHHYPSQLSGGQQQRVALARSLVVLPKVLLLDEPLSALDARIRKHLQIQLREIQKKLNMTMIFVTHDQEEALTMSDRIVVMNQGTIAQVGTPTEIYTQPANQFVAQFIGHYNIIEDDATNEIVGIRPEVMSFVSEDEEEAPGHLYLVGAIKSVTLKGNVIRYDVVTDNNTVSIDLLYRENMDYQVFDKVKLKVASQDIVSL